VSSGYDFRASGAIAALEEELERPVFTGNQAVRRLTGICAFETFERRLGSTLSRLCGISLL
jgi:hypothetical protein